MAAFDPNEMGLPDDQEVERPSFEPPADDWYDMHVVSTGTNEFQTKDMKTVKQFVFEIETISDDPAKRFKFRHACNYVDPDPRSRMTGLHKLNQICKSVGMSGYNEMTDTDQTIGPIFRGYIVSKRQKKDERFWNTNITKWQVDGDEEGAGQPASQATQGSAPANSDAPAETGGNWRDRARQSA